MDLCVRLCVYAEQTEPGREGPRTPRTHSPVFCKEWELKALKDKQIQKFQTSRLFIYFELHLLYTYLKQANNYIMQMKQYIGP